MMTPDSPTFDQGLQLMQLIKDRKLTRVQLQHLFNNWDLVTQLLSVPDLSKIDRDEFRLFVDPAIVWTPVDQYTKLIMARNELRGWGLTHEEISNFADTLVKHAGAHRPTGVNVNLGQGLRHNWEEAMLWLADGLKVLGFEFRDFVGGHGVDLFRHGTQSAKRLQAVGLDLASFGRASLLEIRKGADFAQPTPLVGMEMAWTLALSPQILVAMNGTREHPYIVAPGLSVGRHQLVRFHNQDKRVTVFHLNDTHNLNDTAIATFRHLDR